MVLLPITRRSVSEECRNLKVQLRLERCPKRRKATDIHPPRTGHHRSEVQQRIRDRRTFLVFPKRISRFPSVPQKSSKITHNDCGDSKRECFGHNGEGRGDDGRVSDGLNDPNDKSERDERRASWDQIEQPESRETSSIDSFPKSKRPYPNSIAVTPVTHNPVPYMKFDPISVS